MGMFDYVDAPPVKCECGKIVSGWQTKDLGCDLATVSPDEVETYYSSCRCGRWHRFYRPAMFHLRPFVHDVEGPR